jgi:hypothetical protein
MVADAPDALLQRKIQKTWSGLLQVDYSNPWRGTTDTKTMPRENGLAVAV